MYKKLDRFLNVETWHSRHPLDEARFFKALHAIIKEPDFNPDTMAEHMRGKFKISRDDEHHPFARAIDHYQAAAWAVKHYLEANPAADV